MDNQILQTFIENESNNKSTEKNISIEDWRKLSRGNEKLYQFVNDIDVHRRELESYKDFGSSNSYANYRVKNAAITVVVVCIVLVLTYISINKFSNSNKVDKSNFALLSDSTEVQLFGSSTLTLEDGFDSVNRNLALKGKAFFSVEHNDELPFIITTKNGKVTVKGTSFLVEELGNKLKVAVREGVVEFENNNYTKILKRNEAFIFSDRNFGEVLIPEFSDVFVTKSYSEVSLNEIIWELRAEYNLVIEYATSKTISDCIFNGSFENASVFDILSEWSIMFDLEYVIVNGIIRIVKIECDK